MKIKIIIRLAEYGQLTFNCDKYIFYDYNKMLWDVIFFDKLEGTKIYSNNGHSIQNNKIQTNINYCNQNKFVQDKQVYWQTIKLYSNIIIKLKRCSWKFGIHFFSMVHFRMKSSWQLIEKVVNVILVWKYVYNFIIFIYIMSHRRVSKVINNSFSKLTICLIWTFVIYLLNVIMYWKLATVVNQSFFYSILGFELQRFDLFIL